MPRKIDWNYYREKYIYGSDELTLERLSGLVNAPSLSAIKRRASSEKWASQREAYRHKVATKTQDRVSSTEAEATARHVQISKQLQGIALSRIKDAQESKEKIPLSEVRLWLKDALEIEREALGLNQPSIQIQREVKLQLAAILDAFRRYLEPTHLEACEMAMARAMAEHGNAPTSERSTN